MIGDNYLNCFYCSSFCSVNQKVSDIIGAKTMSRRHILTFSRYFDVIALTVGRNCLLVFTS